MGFRDYRSSGYGSRWAPYVSVGQKLAKASKKAAQLAKKQKREPLPVEVPGRQIATSFWGKAWCDNLEAYSDFSNRLPRGATYVRNGSVVDLVIKRGAVEALVAGSDTYTVKIKIVDLNKMTWNKIKRDCSASIDSLLDLLGGKLSDGVMRRLTEKKGGCFPSPREIEMKCSCPDYSYCCKHIAAVMYGIGSRLDSQPELLFMLRGVDHLELVNRAVSKENLERELGRKTESTLGVQDLGEMFGIELDSATETETAKSPKRSVAAPTRTKSISRAVPNSDKQAKPIAGSTSKPGRAKIAAVSPRTTQSIKPTKKPSASREIAAPGQSATVTKRKTKATKVDKNKTKERTNTKAKTNARRKTTAA